MNLKVEEADVSALIHGIEKSYLSLEKAALAMRDLSDALKLSARTLREFKQIIEDRKESSK